MFTGIVEELGELRTRTDQGDSAELRIRGPLVTQDASPGDSIAVNGVCLTVTDVDGEEFCTDVMAETLAHSTLGDLTPGAPVNLERAPRSDGRFGGHVVQGHVDTTTTVLSRHPGHRWDVLICALPPQVARYVVHKGSITLDGVSLTVSGLTQDTVTVSLIPTTLAATTLGTRAVGERVNVEVDVLAKYVERLVSAPRVTPHTAAQVTR